MSYKNYFYIVILKRLLFLKQVKKKADNPTEKQEKDLNKTFIEEDIQMANKHVEWCSLPLLIRKYKLKPQCNHATPPHLNG